MAKSWAGVDAGKEHHHCVVIDGDGTRLLSRRVLNDETVLLELIGVVTALSDQVTWAIDLNSGGAALLLGLLAGRGQHVVYITGRAVNRAAEPAGERARPTPATPSSSPTGPGRSTGCARSCWRSSPALERVLDVTTRGPVALLTGFRTPAAIRDAGLESVENWLRERSVRRRVNVVRALIRNQRSYQAEPPVTAAA